MNERIKELWTQAEQRQVDDNGGVWVKTIFETRDKFAQLIVQECIAICQDIDGEDNIDAKSGRQDCAVEIQEHFGVE